MGLPLAELARLVDGTIEGDANLIISGVNTLQHAAQGQLSFFSNQKYKKVLQATNASAVLVGSNAPPRGTRTWVVVANPSLAWAKIATAFHPARKFAPGISVQAFIDATARVDASATVMAGAYVSGGAHVGARTVLFPGVFIGDNATVGNDTVLSSNVSVMDRCVVGSRCMIHPSSVVGADGFGFAFDPEKPEHFKIPQSGIVRIEDDVEIGACSTIDRATVGETVIGQGAKIDNLVQVAHNCTVGPMSILCAQVGLSGTTELGTGVVLGGQVGVAGHLRIGDLAKVGAQSGVMSDIDDGAEMMGSPVTPLRDHLRNMGVFQRLPELLRELRDLRKRVETLENKETT